MYMCSPFYFHLLRVIDQENYYGPTHKSSPLIRTAKRLPFDTRFRLANPLRNGLPREGVAFPQRVSPGLVNVSSREVFHPPLVSTLRQQDRYLSRSPLLSRGRAKGSPGHGSPPPPPPSPRPTLDKPLNRFSPSVLLSVYLSMYLYLYLYLSLSLHRNSSPGIGRNLEEEPQPPRGFHLVLDPNYYYYYMVHRYGNFRVKPGGILERF